MQKLKSTCQKRLDDVRNPKAAVAKVSKAPGLNLTPDDIIHQMERLREKVEAEQDPAERDRICARIQGLHSSWQALTGEKEVSTATRGKDLAATLEAELQKHTQELKEVASREQTERAAVEDLRAKIDESQPAIDRLRQEREVCLTVVRQLRDKIAEINSDYSDQFEAFKVAMTEWKTKMDEVMAERYGSQWGSVVEPSTTEPLGHSSAHYSVVLGCGKAEDDHCLHLTGKLIIQACVCAQFVTPPLPRSSAPPGLLVSVRKLLSRPHWIANTHTTRASQHHMFAHVHVH